MTEPTSETAPAESFHPFQILILVLSVLVLVALGARSLFRLHEETVRLLNWFDFSVCLIFLADFFIRFFQAPNKLAFMKWGWIDLLSSIPMVEELRWARFIRVFRVFRILRGFRSLRTFLAFFFRRRRNGAFVVAATTAIVFLLFSALAVLEIERSAPDANIKSAPDALWWALVTMTTVGYGDYFPVTTEGRLLAGLLMLVGIGLFGTLSGIMASFLVGSHTQKESEAIVRLDEQTRKILERMEQREWTTTPKAPPSPPSSSVKSPPSGPDHN